MIVPGKVEGDRVSKMPEFQNLLKIYHSIDCQLFPSVTLSSPPFLFSSMP
jgi:hypothetical protein